jgi:hypothetical protein
MFEHLESYGAPLAMEIVRLLLHRSDTNINSTDRAGIPLLTKAIDLGNPVITRLLLDQKDIDVHCRDSVGLKYEQRMSTVPLAKAIKINDFENVRLLLDRNDISTCRISVDQAPLYVPFGTGMWQSCVYSWIATMSLFAMRHM